MDLIDRQAAIDAVYKSSGTGTALKALKALPSAQPHSNELSKTQMSLDCISRQAAIDTVKKNTLRLTVVEEQNREGHVAWSAYVVYADTMEGALLELSSVQPHPEIIRCKDCKHHRRDNTGCYYCARKDYGYGWGLNDFCSDAERKDGD